MLFAAVLLAPAATSWARGSAAPLLAAETGTSIEAQAAHAERLMDDGRYEEAQAAVATTAPLTGYATAQRHYIRFIAAQQRGDKTAAADAARGVSGQGPGAADLLSQLPLAAGRMNEATVMLIVQLESVKLRSSALLSLQQMRTAPTLPADAALPGRWRELVARPEVQAALAEVGRIDRYDLFASDHIR